MKRLIVNADDFGLTPGINRAIMELNFSGVLSSATLMANAPGFEDAARGAQDRHTLGVGCHVTFVDGKPLLLPGQLPNLVVRREGLFRETLGSFVTALLRREIPESEIEAEATAQIRRLQSAGVLVTHLDTHKHTHMFPGVLRPLLRAAQACGVRAIRNPFEPRWCTDVTGSAGALRRFQVKTLGLLKGRFLDACRETGIKTTDGAIGVLATGCLDADTLRSFLHAMPDGTWELCCHPGYHDAALDDVRTRLRESRETERRALLEVLPEARGISLIHFGELVNDPPNLVEESGRLDASSRGSIL